METVNRDVQAPTSTGETLVVGWRPATTQALEGLGQKVTCVLSPGQIALSRKQGFTGEIVVVPDPTNVEHVLAGLERQNIELKNFLAVGTNLESAVVAASVVGEIAQARCIPTRASVLLRDKVAQKAAVRAAGLPVADCSVINTLDELPTAEEVYPLVVKPLSGCAAVDTFLLRSAQEAADLSADRSGAQGYGPWAVEEYIDGAEVMIDGVLREGRLEFLTISRYLQNIISIKDGGHLVGSVLLERANHAALYERAHDLVTRALGCLGHTDGVFHMEAFHREDELVFSECAGRTSGGFLHEMLAEKFGIDMVEEWARGLIGEPVAVPDAPRTELCVGFALLVSEAGEIVSFPPVEEVLKFDGVVQAKVEISAGTVAEATSTSSNTKAGRFVVAAATEEQVEEQLRACVDWFKANMVVREV